MKINKNKIKSLIYFLTSNFKLFRYLFYYINGKYDNMLHSLNSGIRHNINNSSSIGNFRRNIHRIEKGLVTIPQKDIFAESYINNVVKTFQILENNCSDSETLKWSYNVLNLYFSKVKKTEPIIKAEKIFRKISDKDLDKIYSPYKVEERETSTITYDELLKLNRQRRSVRYFLNKNVPRDIIEKAWAIGLQSPSACNRQPFTVHIVDDDDSIKKAAKLPMGATTFCDGIKMIIFIIGDYSYYFDERDKHVIYIDSSLAAMNFLLALETLGLSSCIINWSDIKEKNNELSSFLRLNDWEQCVMSIAVGYADPKSLVPSSIKKSTNNIIKYYK